MEKHDHPTSRQRLGDSAAGLGAAATLSLADAAAIRSEVRGVQYVSAGVHESARVVRGDTPLVHAAPRRRNGPAPHPAKLDLHARPLFFQPRIRGRRPGGRARHGRTPASIRRRDKSRRRRGVASGTSPFASSVWWRAPTGRRPGRLGDDQFDAVYVPLTAVHRLLNLTKLNSITITSRSAGETTRRVARRDGPAAPAAPHRRRAAG